MQFVFMYQRRTIDAVFIVRMMQEEYHSNGKKVLYVFCGPSFLQGTMESVQMINGEGMDTRSFG